MTIRGASRRTLKNSRKRSLYSSLFLLTIIIILILRRPRDISFVKRALVSSKGSERLLIITASNWMYREFLANFACNIHHVSQHRRPLVYSLDRRTHAFAAVLGLSSVLLTNDEGDDVRPGSFERNGPRSFDEITKKKLIAVRQALESGLDVLLSDADIYWCTDAAQVIEQLAQNEPYSDADVLIQPEAEYRTLNSGFYYVRSTNNTLQLFDKLINNTNLGAHDQDVVNMVFCDPAYGGRRINESYKDVPFYCESQGARIRVLPSRLFPSGAEVVDGVKVFSHSRQKLLRMCKEGKFVVLHNNFIRANKKKSRFIQKGMWFVTFKDPEQPYCEQLPIPESAVAARTCGAYC